MCTRLLLKISVPCHIIEMGYCVQYSSQISPMLDQRDLQDFVSLFLRTYCQSYEDRRPLPSVMFLRLYNKIQRITKEMNDIEISLSNI